MVKENNFSTDNLKKELPDDIEVWFKNNTVKQEKPNDAFELAEQRIIGDIETSARRLDDLRKLSLGNINSLNESGRKKCRQEAIIFLTEFTKTPFFSGFNDKDNVKPIFIFAKQVIQETPELEDEYPSKGLEDIIISDRGVKAA